MESDASLGMKRDMDLVRLLLLRQEGNAEAKARISAKYDEEKVTSHGAMVIEAGFIRGHVAANENKVLEAVIVVRLPDGMLAKP